MLHRHETTLTLYCRFGRASPWRETEGLIHAMSALPRRDQRAAGSRRRHPVPRLRGPADDPERPGARGLGSAVHVGFRVARGAVPPPKPGPEPVHPRPPCRPDASQEDPSAGRGHGPDHAQGSSADDGPGDAGLGDVPHRPGGTPASNGRASLDQVLAEIQAVRETQSMILSLLLARPGAAVESPVGGATSSPSLSPQPGVLDAAAHAPPQVGAADRRRSGHARRGGGRDGAGPGPGAGGGRRQRRDPAIAAEKPDVIALELDIGGSMAGKDVINMIKATMEWVDIPILLYTRAAPGEPEGGAHGPRRRRAGAEAERPRRPRLPGDHDLPARRVASWSRSSSSPRRLLAGPASSATSAWPSGWWFRRRTSLHCPGEEA